MLTLRRAQFDPPQLGGVIMNFEGGYVVRRGKEELSRTIGRGWLLELIDDLNSGEKAPAGLYCLAEFSDDGKSGPEILGLRITHDRERDSDTEERGAVIQALRDAVAQLER